jgi:hypothetical protein
VGAERCDGGLDVFGTCSEVVDEFARQRVFEISRAVSIAALFTSERLGGDLAVSG